VFRESSHPRVRIVVALGDLPIILSMIVYTLALRMAATEWLERGKLSLYWCRDLGLWFFFGLMPSLEASYVGTNFRR
jgi:hypothetical protein